MKRIVLNEEIVLNEGIVLIIMINYYQLIILLADNFLLQSALSREQELETKLASMQSVLNVARELATDSMIVSGWGVGQREYYLE